MKHPVLIAGALALGLIVAGAASGQPQGGGGGGGAGVGVRQACAADFQKFCPDAKPGPGGGLRECVAAHHADFSDACKSAIAAMRAARQQQGGGAGGN
jgi:hypothetical protein